MIISGALILGCGGGGGPEAAAGQDSSAHARQCSETIATCFSVSSVQIAKYKGAKQAAASFTFDDGLMSAFQVADIFNQQNLKASFYINPGLIRTQQEWQKWQAVAAQGHEIGNHTMWHTKVADASLADSVLKFQILDAQALIEQKIGVRPLVFVFPYDAFDDRSMKLVMSSHIATRLPGFRTDPTYKIVDFVSTLTLPQANSTLQDVVNTGGWFVAAGHGIDGNGWSPVSADFLKDHLSFAQALSNKLWIDTFAEVSRYRLCRDLARAEVVLTNDQASIRVAGDFSGGFCTTPLTIVLPILEQPKSTIVLRNEDGQPVPFQQSDKNVIVDLVPGHTLQLSLKTSQ